MVTTEKSTAGGLFNRVGRPFKAYFVLLRIYLTNPIRCFGSPRLFSCHDWVHYPVRIPSVGLGWWEWRYSATKRSCAPRRSSDLVSDIGDLLRVWESVGSEGHVVCQKDWLRYKCEWGVGGRGWGIRELEGESIERGGFARVVWTLSRLSILTSIFKNSSLFAWLIVEVKTQVKMPSEQSNNPYKTYDVEAQPLQSSPLPSPNPFLDVSSLLLYIFFSPTTSNKQIRPQASHPQHTTSTLNRKIYPYLPTPPSLAHPHLYNRPTLSVAAIPLQHHHTTGSNSTINDASSVSWSP